MKVNVFKNFENDKKILPVSKRCLVKKQPVTISC